MCESVSVCWACVCVLGMCVCVGYVCWACVSVLGVCESVCWACVGVCVGRV